MENSNNERCCLDPHAGWTCSLTAGHLSQHQAYSGHRLDPDDFCCSWDNTDVPVSDEEVAEAIASIKRVSVKECDV